MAAIVSWPQCDNQQYLGNEAHWQLELNFWTWSTIDCLCYAFFSTKPMLTYCRFSASKHMVYCWVDINVGNFISLWPSDTIWRHRIWSLWFQVEACYLNLCWPIISLVIITWRQVCWKYWSHQLTKLSWKVLTLNLIQISQRPMN